LADRIRILVADDDKLIRELLSDILEDSGYHVALASDGEEALGKVHSEPPDLILLDILMPKRNGIQVSQELKGDPATSGIPIIIITSLPGTPAGQVSRADLYLQKPVRPDELLRHVRKFLPGRETPPKPPHHGQTKPTPSVQFP
jgi:CheY-like chemotaxis protein